VNQSLPFAASTKWDIAELIGPGIPAIQLANLV
jgi:hypothetical protein